MYHDLGDYEALEKGNVSLLEALRVPKEKIEQASRIITLMYKTSDEADVQLGLGDSKKHDELFGRIFDMAKELDAVLGISYGSVQDEIRWWYRYRLSRSKVKGKKPRRVSSFYHFVLALFFIYVEHVRRIRNPIASLKCTYWLAKAGRKHEKDDWTRTKSTLERYWSAKIAGNSGKIEPMLILV
ncbi:MAG: hypothetical protein HYU02_02160 [Thaumarchaeota archaeon]|nr:hypothetical protein [Nitrososphaerota archaeon]